MTDFSFIIESRPNSFFSELMMYWNKMYQTAVHANEIWLFLPYESDSQCSFPSCSSCIKQKAFWIVFNTAGLSWAWVRCKIQEWSEEMSCKFSCYNDSQESCRNCFHQGDCKICEILAELERSWLKDVRTVLRSAFQFVSILLVENALKIDLHICSISWFNDFLLI